MIQIIKDGKIDTFDLLSFCICILIALKLWDFIDISWLTIFKPMMLYLFAELVLDCIKSFANNIELHIAIENELNKMIKKISKMFNKCVVKLKAAKKRIFNRVGDTFKVLIKGMNSVRVVKREFFHLKK